MITELDAEQIIMAFTCWLCALIFLAIGIWAHRSKKPMHFWAGTTVSPAEISDVPAYNKANAILWTIYSLPYFFIGALDLVIGPEATAIVLTFFCFGTLPLLILGYLRIERKYRI